MNKISSFKNKNILFLLFLLSLVLFNHLYYQFLSPHVGLWLIITVETAWIALWLLLVRKWFSAFSLSILKVLEKSQSDSVSPEDVIGSINKNDVFMDIIVKIFNYQSSQEKEQQKLLEKLRYSNTLLRRNSKITESIMQITNQILISGEIDEILQTILENAIAIIPNAQKGSILIYNGDNLEFRAAYGYDFEMLKKMTLEVEEIFQYNVENFYEPCIINNPEVFNSKHMKKSKYEVLRDNRVFELKSILSCAIKVDNEFYGIINLDCTEENNPFSKDDMPLIKHLATQIGIALKTTSLIEKIIFLSRHDSLTGIFNRCSFEEHLMRIYQQSKASGSVFSLVLLDINDLKKVNDTYGHEAGDLLLKIFAKGVAESLDNDDMFARYGGDEFALIFPDKNREQTEYKMKKIRAVFEETPLIYCGKKIANISFGFGITEFPDDTTEFEELIKLSDERMYKDKEEIKKPIL